MRYTHEHKAETRRRILHAAGEAFRERGVAEAGIDEVMRRAGLTHGGFYAHFRGKEELLAESCLAAFEEAVGNLDRIASQRSLPGRVRVLVDSYLAPRHRDNRASGCLVAAVATDMARLDGTARRGFSSGFSRHVDRLAAALRFTADPEQNRFRTVELLSAMVGALLIARAMEDRAASDAVLVALRERLRRSFGVESSDANSSEPARRGVPLPDNDFLLAHSLFLA